MARAREGRVWKRGGITYRAFLEDRMLQFGLESEEPFPPGTAAHIVVAYDTGQCFERLHGVVFIDNPPSRVSTLAFDERGPPLSLSAERPFLYRIEMYRMIGGKRVPGTILSSGGEKLGPEYPLRPGAAARPRGRSFPRDARGEFERVCRGAYNKTLLLTDAEVENFVNSESPRAPRPSPGDSRGHYARRELLERAQVKLVALGLKPVTTIGGLAVAKLARKSRGLTIFKVSDWLGSSFVVSRARTIEGAIGDRIKRVVRLLPNPRGVLRDYGGIKHLTLDAVDTPAIYRLVNSYTIEGLLYGYRPCCVRHVLGANALRGQGARVARGLGALGGPLVRLCCKIADRRLGPPDPCGLLIRCPGCRARGASPREYFSWWLAEQREQRR